MSSGYQNLPPITQQRLDDAASELAPPMSVEEVKEYLEYSAKGMAKNNRVNGMFILEHDPLLRGMFGLNILSDQTDIVGKAWWERPWGAMFTDMDMNYVMYYLESTYGISMDKVMEKCIDLEADKHKYHPICDYLNALKWDGKERIPHALHRSGLRMTHLRARA